MSKLRDAIQASRRGETVGSADTQSGSGTSVLRQAIQASRRGETVEPTSGAPKLPQSLQGLLETQRSGTGLASGTSAYQNTAGQRQENAVEQQTGISWPSVENAQENLQSWSGRLDSLRTRLETARTDAQAKAQELENIYTKLQAYQADSQFGSSTLIRSAYDSLAEQYNQLLPAYLKAASEHDSLAEEYNALLEKYQSGYTAYTDMLSGQGARADELLQEAEQAEREANEARTALSGINRYGTKEQQAEWTAKLEEAESRAAQLREQAEQARAYYYASIPLMEDYNQYAKAGTAKGEADDLNLWKFWQERGDNLYDFINDLKQNPEDELSYRQTVELLSTMGGQNGKYGAYTPYSYMTEDEIGIYNYLYATAGREAAEDFLDELMNSLNYRQGEENYENLSGVGKALYWLPAGADSFASGVAQLFSEKALPTSPVQYTSAMVSQEAHEANPVLGTAYDLGTTVSNMAPSILLGTLSAGLLGGAGVAAGAASAIGSGVTAGTMGLSSAGNAYNRKVSEGYAPEQARSYAALVGMAEGALQYLLGGIAGAGGVTSEQLLSRLAPKITAIDNALLRTVVDGGVRLTVRGVSEGIEEGMQAFLEPAFATLILDEEYDWGENFENAAYSFLMGFLAADLFEGISMAAGGRHSGGGFDPDMDGYVGQDGTDYFAGCSTAEEVETRYRELARENHPDLGGDTDVMADINRQHDMRKAWFMGQRQAEQAGKKENTRPHTEAEALLSGTAQAFAAAGDTVTESMDKAAVMDRVLSGDTALTDSEIAQLGLRSSSTREAFRALTGREITGNTVQERITSVREVMEARKRGSEAARDGAEELPTAVPQERQEPPAAEIPGANYARELQQAGADADTARAVGYLLSRAEQGMTLTEDQRSYIATVPGGAALMDRVQPAAQQPREAGREAGVSLPVEAVPAGDTVREAGAAAPETEMTIGGWNDGRQEQLGEQQPGAAPGDGVPDGGQGRIPGPGAGEQAGGLGTGAARAVPPAEQGRTAIGRQNRGKHLRSERVSSIDLGLSNGTENPSVYVVQEADWDEGLRATAERVRRETGLGVTYVLGSIPVKDARGVVRNVRGVYGTDRIILQADNLRVTTDQIADHEIYHDKAFQTPGLNREIELRIVERYGREEFEAVVAVYAEKLRGVVELSADAAPEEIDAAMQVVKEEIFADAYAGINAFAAHAERFQEGVDEVLEERGLGRSRETAAATDRTTGPPGERYSYGGENANRADSESLAEAERLEMQGVDPETIRQETGWHRGMEGLWRFEMDDSGMVYDKNGNLQGAVTKQWAMEDMDAAWQDLKDAVNDEQLERVREYLQMELRDPVEAEKLYRPLLEEIGRPFEAWEEARRWALENRGRSDGGTLADYTMAVGKTKSANSLLMHSLYAVADIGSGPEIIKLYVEEMNDPNSAGTAKRAYQLQNVEKYRPATKSSQKTASSISAGADTKSVADGLDAVKGGDAAERAYQLQNIEISSPTGGKPTISSGKALASLQTADIKSVADLFEAVKRADSNFRPKEPSAVTDEEGRPMAVYHGTDRSFWRFDPEMGAYWFSQAEDYAQAMAEERGGDRVLSAYLDMKNPMRVSLPAGTFTDPAAEGPYIRRANAEGYDGVIFQADTDNPLEADTFYAVFRPEQIKSATDNIGTFDRENRDIRYSMDEEQNTEQTEQQEQPKQKKRATRRQRTTRPVAESLPIIAKRDLKQNLLNLFSIPEGMRAELGTVIDQYADRLLKNGTLTQADRDAFFDRMYAEGVMTVPAEEYYAMGRNAVKGGRVYVPVRDQHEFGGEWNEFRKRAFANGIYLTNNPQDQGIEQWNTELAEMMPGLFGEEETGSRAILERIVQVAEEGRDQKMSLSEYAAELAGREYVSEDEVLDNMERQMDWALRTFAEKARLEITLRDRTGVKIAQEREKFSEAAGRQREREMARRAEERDRRKAQLRRQRENKELRELQQKTLKQLQWLSKNRYRAPEELKEAWDEVLGDIDIYAVGAANEMNWSNKYQATWRDLAQLYKTARDADPNFLPSKELERIVDRLDGDKIADLDVDALADLYKAAVGLRTEFYNRNNVINDELNRLFAEVYTDSKREIETAPGGYKGSGFDRFMNLDQLTPMNVLERMGGWNPDGAFYSMARQLEKGEQDIRAYTVQANRRLEEFLTEHEDWVKRADGQGKDGIWYEIEVPELLELGMGDKPVFGDTVKVYMTPSQKVHMYLESKNTDNLRHMTGGRTFVDRELYSQGKRQEAFAQGRTIRMAPETVKGLVSNLTEEEAELARILEDYYNNFAKGEINRVSNILYGYDKAQSKNYAPIYTNRNYVKSEIGIYDTTAEGVGSLKSRQYAKNPSYNISAFDAFERHVEQTARFVGMAIPARNWTTLLNWREKNDSMGDVITHKWGEESKKYIEDILNRLQGGAAVERDTVGDFADKVLSNYISAIFGANPSIVLKQLGSIPLASAYLGGATFPSLTQITRIDRELIAKYTGDLAWRTMGYSTPETKHLKENPNWTQTNKVTRFAFGGGAITAMDGWAASVLWPWAENKVRRDFPDLEVGTQEQIDAGQSPFYKKVAEAFNEAVSRSQSVSDEIHQGRLRKSRNPITRAFTMFKSDSAQGYNALRQKIGEAKYYERAGDAENTRKARKAVGAAFLSLIGGYLWASVVSFLIAMWKNKGKYYRDDEDELTFGSVVREMVMDLSGSLVGVVAGGEELMDIIGNVLTGDTWYGIDTPGLEQLTDIIELLQKETTNGMDTLKGAADVAGSGGDLVEYMKRHGNDMLGGIKELAEAAATYIPGIPVSNLEAYILGTVKWISPELGTAYDDLMATAEKSGLSGLEGAALERRVDSILSVRLHDIPEGAAAELAGLYEAGYTQAVPGDTPAKVTVNGEEQALGAYQQQIYDTVWRESVEAPLAQLLEQEWYTSLDDETRAKVLAKLYDYGAQSAKAALFDDFKTDSFVEEISAYQAAGLDTADWLEAWRRFSEIEDGGANASARATEFAYWADSQGYTPEQAKVVKDSFTVFSHIPVEPQRYGDLQEAGLSDSEALDLTDALAALEPLEGASAVSDIQRLRAIADAGLDRETTVAAMGTILGTEMTTESGGKSQYALLQEALDAGYTVDEWLELKEAGYMTESTFDKVRISGQYDISPSQYIRYREMLVEEDATNEDPEKRNNSIDQDETAAAINGMLGLSNEQKAVLWQLQNKSWKPNKNPFDKQVGKVVYDYLHEEKEDETPALTDGESLPALSLPGLFG